VPSPNPKLTDEQLRAVVRNALSYRSDYFKVYARLSPQAVASVIDEAHKHSIPVIGHMGQTSWLEAARRQEAPERALSERY
jgi:hypothetical protein